MKKLDAYIEIFRKILRVFGVILGTWSILILLISFLSLKEHYQRKINHNNNVNTQIVFLFQTFFLFIYLVFLPFATSFFLLILTKKKEEQHCDFVKKIKYRIDNKEI